MGAALAVNAAVIGLHQMLSVTLDDEDEPEDQTDAQWATDRLNRLRLRSRQLRQQRRRNRAGQPYESPLPYIRLRAKFKIDYLRNSEKFAGLPANFPAAVSDVTED
jgi:hypothetical protein